MGSCFLQSYEGEGSVGTSKDLATLKGMRFSTLISCCLLLLFIACQKEEPERPKLEVHAPTKGFKVGIGDTLRVELEAASKEGLEKLSLAIVGAEEGEQKVSGISFDLQGGRSIHRSFDYPIQGKVQGEGSEQVLRVLVEDGQETRNTAYVEGRVEGEPLYFEKAFVVFRPKTDRVEVKSFIGEQEGMRPFSSLSMDYSGSASHWLHGQFVVGGSETGDLRAFDGVTGEEVWKVLNQGASPRPYFLGTSSDRNGEWVFASLGTGRLEGFRGASGPDLTVDALDGHIIEEHAFVGDRLLTEQESDGNDPRQWVSYYASTGSLGSQRQIPDRDIVRILEAGSNEALVLANENGQGRLFRYRVQERVFETVTSLPSGKVRGGVRTENGKSLLVHDQGLLLHESGSDIIRTLRGIRPQAIAYDQVNDRIICGDGKSLKVLGGEEGELRWEKSFSDSIEAVHAFYKR